MKHSPAMPFQRLFGAATSRRLLAVFRLLQLQLGPDRRHLMSGYRLVACTVSGVNAFFVRQDLAGVFASYPASALYQPYRYHLFYPRGGQEPTLKFLADALRPSR